MKVSTIKRMIAWILVLMFLPLYAGAAASDMEIMSIAANAAKAQLTVRMRVPDQFSTSDFLEEAAVTVAGKKVTIDKDSVQHDLPVGYILVVDRSGYYTAYLKYEYVKHVAMQIIQAMKEEDRVAVVFVDSGVECNDTFMLKSAASTLINSSESAQRGNNNMPTEAMLYQGLQKALTLSSTTGKQVPEQKAIIVLSDFGADDAAKTKNAFFKKVDSAVPLFTVPFWCQGYSSSSNSRREAMDTADTGRSELLGYTFFNAEMVIPNGGEFDTSQIATITNAIREKMNFISFTVNIQSLYSAKGKAADRELLVAFDNREVSQKVNFDTSAIVTPKPAKATAKPTPESNPVILKFGDENSDVLLLQQILTELYYYNGEMNRKFDTQVQIAMMEFCSDHGLEFGDEIRKDVWQFIQSDKAKPKATPVPTPTPAAEATRDPDIYLQMGDKDAKVYNLQTKLMALGYLTEEERSMVFDEATQLALYSFCEENGLELRDGLTVTMWNLLQSGNAVAKPTATPEPTVVITPEPTRDPQQMFAIGDQNGSVRALQNYLISHYYLDAQYRTGIFDVNTQWAVDEFCIVNNVKILDDGMSLEAWEMLQSGTALAKATEVPVTATPAPTRDPQLKFVLGDINDQVIVLQRRLAQMYYMNESDISGEFDQQTLIAVVTFCDVNGLATNSSDVMNGMSVAAWDMLMAGIAVPNPTATPAPTAVPTAVPTPVPTEAPLYLAVQPGDSNTYVLNYQTRLVELGYLTEEFTAGVYDDATQAAQDMLCEYNNLTSQAGADVDLQQFAFSEAIRDMKGMGFMDKLMFAMGRSVNIASLEIPVWILACVGLVIFLAVLVVLLVSPGKKKAANAGGVAKETTAAAADNATALTAQDLPTGDLDIDTNADVPTSENVNSWKVVLTIQYMGSSQDYHYSLEDNVPLRIGRRSGSEVLINPEDTMASRDHGMLVYRGNSLYYRDMSKKGSIVDGEPLHMAEREVKTGSVIEISRHMIRIVT